MRTAAIPSSPTFLQRPEFLPGLALLFILLIPNAAYGNMLTPMMIVPMVQLLYGNILLGIFEGFLIGLLFKANTGKAIGIMIGANYFSMIAGSIFHQILESLLWASLLQTANIYNFANLILFSIILFWAI